MKQRLSLERLALMHVAVTALGPEGDRARSVVTLQGGSMHHGTLYRLGVALKELGERIRLPGLIRLGLAIRERAL